MRILDIFKRKNNERYIIKFSLDNFATCLWGINDRALNDFGTSIDYKALGLSDSLINKLENFDKKVLEIIDWENPGSKSPMSEEEQGELYKIGQNLMIEVGNELGANFEIIDGLDWIKPKEKEADKSKNDMKCPVCGNFTFNSKDYLYYTCKECFWEYDPIQVDDPNYPGGANEKSLKEYKKVYKKLKSKNPKFSCKNEKDKELMLKMLTKEELETNEKEMDLINEIHYYKIGLLSGVFTINDFQKWLDETFMKSDERILLNLEECKNINEIISCINSYFYNINYDRNPKNPLKEIMKVIEYKYNSNEWSLKQILNYFDKIYLAILNDGDWWQEEPYLLIGNLSDGYGTWAYDEDIIKGVKKVFEYFK